MVGIRRMSNYYDGKEKKQERAIEFVAEELLRFMNLRELDADYPTQEKTLHGALNSLTNVIADKVVSKLEQSKPQIVIGDADVEPLQRQARKQTNVSALMDAAILAMRLERPSPIVLTGQRSGKTDATTEFIKALQAAEEKAIKEKAAQEMEKNIKSFMDTAFKITLPSSMTINITNPLAPKIERISHFEFVCPLTPTLTAKSIDLIDPVFTTCTKYMDQNHGDVDYRSFTVEVHEIFSNGRPPIHRRNFTFRHSVWGSWYYDRDQSHGEELATGSIHLSNVMSLSLFTCIISHNYRDIKSLDNV